MTYWPSECPRCRIMPKLVRSYRGWDWRCLCPPLPTYTSDNTAPTANAEQTVREKP